MSRVTLVLGNKNYSSWSMRAWLLLQWLGCEFDELMIPLYREDSLAAVLPYSPSGMLPALIDGELRVWDSFGIILHMADRYPQVWPADPARRAFVQSISAEMHAGFMALRTAMPHNARGRNRRVPITTDVRKDIERAESIWTEGRERFGDSGPWLAGEFGTADIMYAPVASRFRTYGVTLSGSLAEAYRLTLLEHPLVERWFSEGADEVEVIAEGEFGSSGLPTAAALLPPKGR